MGGEREKRKGGETAASEDGEEDSDESESELGKLGMEIEPDDDVGTVTVLGNPHWQRLPLFLGKSRKLDVSGGRGRLWGRGLWDLSSPENSAFIFFPGYN